MLIFRCEEGKGGLRGWKKKESNFSKKKSPLGHEVKNQEINYFFPVRLGVKGSTARSYFNPQLQTSKTPGVPPYPDLSDQKVNLCNGQIILNLKTP